MKDFRAWINATPMWQAYFSSKNYRVFYLHSFGSAVAVRLAEIFTGVYFYTLGMPLHFILLFWALEFGLRGALCPLGPMLFSRLGSTRTVTFAYSAFLVYFLMVAATPFSMTVGFLAFALHSLAMSVYYPCLDGLHALLVEEETRGRQNSCELIVDSLAGLVAVAVGSLVLSRYPFYVLAVMVALLLALSALAVSRLEAVRQERMEFRDSYRHLASAQFRPFLSSWAAYALAVIANIMVVPLFIFIRVGKIETFGIVIAAALFVEIIVLALAGQAVDKWKRAGVLKSVLGLQAIGNIAYLFLGQSPVAAFGLSAYNTNAWNAVRNNLETGIQRIMSRNARPFVFAAAVQMALCFTEVVALSIFALVAWWDSRAAFVLIFAASAAALCHLRSFGRKSQMARAYTGFSEPALKGVNNVNGTLAPSTHDVG